MTKFREPVQSELNNKLVMDAKRDTSIEEFYGSRLLKFIEEEYKRVYKDNEIRTHEITQCMRRSLAERLIGEKAITYTSAQHFSVGWIYENGLEDLLVYSGLTYLERDAEYSQSILDKKYEWIGHIDFDTNWNVLGVAELKSISTFWKLSRYENLRTKLGPKQQHLDRLLAYLVLTNKSIGSLIYISKMALQGFLPFYIRIGQVEEGKPKSNKRFESLIKEAYLERAKTYARLWEDIKRLRPLDPSQLGEVAEFLNEAPATPSGDCAYCIFGGHYSKSFRPMIEGFTNFCEEKINYRVHPKSVWSSDRTKKSGEKPITYPLENYLIMDLLDKDSPYIKYAGIFDRKSWLEENAINMFLQMGIKPNLIRHLAGCPRKAHYFSKGNEIIKKIYTNNKGTKTRAIDLWKETIITKNLLKIYQKDDKTEHFKYEKYTGKVPKINGHYTLINPVAKVTAKYIREEVFPYLRDIFRALAIYAIKFKDKEKFEIIEGIKILYIGIRTGNFVVYNIKPIDSTAVNFIKNIIDNVIFYTKRNIGTPHLWCGWCPIARISIVKNPEPENYDHYLCPIGRNYLTRNRAARTIEKMRMQEMEERVPWEREKVTILKEIIRKTQPPITVSINGKKRQLPFLSSEEVLQALGIVSIRDI
ncbi:MAG: hypothetical protein GF317_05845 [Candidatus Lokiarchaeota archaeon]|nr:hypothetical protein [Candidatus Lokiarchaeota archaeon]